MRVLLRVPGLANKVNLFDDAGRVGLVAPSGIGADIARQTPLHAAVQNGQTDFVFVLAECKADVNAVAWGGVRLGCHGAVSFARSGLLEPDGLHGVCVTVVHRPHSILLYRLQTMMQFGSSA